MSALVTHGLGGSPSYLVTKGLGDYGGGLPIPPGSLPVFPRDGFIIGVTPIGTIPPFDYHLTVISQYANSPVILQLLSDFYQYIDQTRNMDEFFDMIWNIDLARGYGLDVWGRIVGVTRTLQVAVGDYFGFQEAGGASIQPFNTAPFYSGGGVTTNYSLSDKDFRTLIFAKALANISDGSIPALNQLLLNLFPGRGNCYVTDEGGMAMTWTFKFIPSAVEAAILTQSGVLPKPAGVSDSIVFAP
jgi:hypothetical protein